MVGVGFDDCGGGGDNGSRLLACATLLARCLHLYREHKSRFGRGRKILLNDVVCG